MKILIVSDTHKQNKNLVKVLEKVSPIDLMIHLGDSEGSEEFFREIAGCPVEMIAGNNDFFSELEKEKEIQIGKYRVLLSHGHYYYVTVGVENLRSEGIGRGLDVVMFGHTHRPYINIEDNITMINPGSLSYPRQNGHKPTYIIMEIDKNGEAHYTLNTVN